MQQHEFIPIPEAAAVLGVVPSRIYQLVRAREIPYTRIGGRIRIPRAAWDTWLQRQTELALRRVVDPEAQEV